MIHQLLHRRIFRIQNTQRIAVQAALRFLIQQVLVRLKIRNQRLAVRRAFTRHTQGIDLQTHVQTQIIPQIA